MNIECADAFFRRVAVVLNREDCAEILRRLLADPLSVETANELVARLRSELPELADVDDNRLSVLAEHGPDHEYLDIRRVLLAIDDFSVALGAVEPDWHLRAQSVSREIATQ